MVLHPQAQRFVDLMLKERVPPLSSLSPAEARVWDAKVSGFFESSVQPIGGVRDLEVAGPRGMIRLRVYTPHGASDPDKMLVYFHGGGWVLGNLDLVDSSCRLLSNATNRVVASVDYRLAPEHRFPVSPEDCYAATKWVAENAGKLGSDAKYLAVCGDSAGGNLAAAVSLMAKDRGTPSIESQVLIYPVTDLSENYREFPDDLSPALTKNDMRWFIGHYLANIQDAEREYASPLLRRDPSGLPSALIITAEYDILTNQCNAYSDKLREAGVRVNSKRYVGMVHGFFTLPDAFDAAHDAIRHIAEELSET